MSLYLKYRPEDLSQIKGNEAIVTPLRNMLEDIESCPHSFLLYGPTGCGKTTIARIIAKRLGCVGEDLQEVDIGDYRGIDTIRDIRRNSMFSPMDGNARVWIMDEAHKMTGDAMNALLKILEEPPPHVYFVLCTTEPQKLLPTIRGRCQQFQVLPLTETQMRGLLRKIIKEEGESLENEVIDQIITNTNGLPRNALQLLEQVFCVPKEMRLEVAQKFEAETAQAIDLCRALLKNAGWGEIRGILQGLKGQDAESIRRVVLGYCQSVLLNEDKAICGLILEEFITPFYDSGFPQLVYACYSVTKNR